MNEKQHDPSPAAEHRDDLDATSVDMARQDTREDVGDAEKQDLEKVDTIQDPVFGEISVDGPNYRNASDLLFQHGDHVFVRSGAHR